MIDKDWIACSSLLSYLVEVKMGGYEHLHDAFGDVKAFLENKDLSPSQLKLLEI